MCSYNAAELINRIRTNIDYEINNVFYYSDSQITLSWINRSPSTLKTFVANRVLEIQTVSRLNEWFFIKGTDNPADHLSRGLFPSELVQCKHWFQGPEF